MMSRALWAATPDDTVTAISIFKDYAGAEESNKRALACIALRRCSLDQLQRLSGQ